MYDYLYYNTELLLDRADKGCYKYEHLAPKVVEYYSKGLEVRVIAAKLGIRSIDCIYRFIREAGLEMRRGRYRSRGRLSHAERKLIEKLYRQGLPIYSIAKAVGRHPSTVYYYLRRLKTGEK